MKKTRAFRKLLSACLAVILMICIGSAALAAGDTPELKGPRLSTSTYTITWKVYVYENGNWHLNTLPSKNYTGTSKGDSYNVTDWSWAPSGSSYTMTAKVNSATNATVYVKRPSDLWTYDSSKYEFVGWSKNGADLTPSYPASVFNNNYSYSEGGAGPYNVATRTATYYFILKAKETSVNYTLNYDGNAGGDTVTNLPSQQTGSSTSGSYTFNISSAKPQRSDYVFAGWAVSPTGAAAYQSGGTITLYSADPSETLYAVWKEDKNNNGEADEDEDKFDIIYQTEDAANVTGMPSGEQDVLPGLEKEVSSAVPTRPGYVFGGWSTSDVTVNNGKFIMPEKDVTFTAIWKEDKNNNGEADEDEDKFDIIYQTEDAANVTGMPSGEQDVLPGLEKEVSSAVPTRPGYVFGGWSTSDVTVNNGKFIMPEKDVTFTAIWKEDKNNNGIADEDEEKYDIIFETEAEDEVTGMPSDIQNVLPGMEIELPSEIPTRPGYVFSGWSVMEGMARAASEVTVVDGKFIMPEKDVTFIAIWKEDKNNNGVADEDEDKFDIIYQTEDAENVTGMPSGEQDVLSGLVKEVSDAVPVREGYIFKGWATDDATVQNGQFAMPEKDVVFTALWEKKDSSQGTGDQGIIAAAAAVALLGAAFAAVAVIRRRKKGSVK